MIKLSGKYFILYWGVGILIAVCILGNLQRDRFAYESVPAEVVYYESFTEEKDGLGALEEGIKLSLKEGGYTVEADVNSVSDADVLVVRAKDAVSPDNESGVVFASQMPERGRSQVTFHFTLEQDYDHVTVAFLSSKEAFNQSVLYGYSMVSDGLIYQDTVFLAGLWVCLLIAVRFLFLRRQDVSDEKQDGVEIEWTPKLKKTLFFMGVTVLVSLPLFTDFLPNGHDLSFHLNRIEGIAQGMKTGQFPVRVNPVFNGGSGYLSETMYPGLLLYLPALLRLCGVSLLLSFKVYCVVLNFLTAVISYFAFTRITDSHRIGVLSCVIYTFSLYRINNLLCRGAMGEWTAMAFLPLVLWGLWELFYGDERKWPVLVLGLTFVFQSHLISMLLCLMFCVLWGLAGIRRLKKGSRSLAICKAAAMTVLLNGFTIVPMFYFLRKGMAIAEQERMIGDYAAYLPQVFSQFIYSDSFVQKLGEVQGEMPITLGGIFLIGILLFLYIGYYKKGLPSCYRKQGTVFLAGGLLAILLSLNWFPWNLLQSIPKLGRLFGMIQFPFRFLMFATLLLTPVIAVAVGSLIQKETAGAAAVVFTVCFLGALYSFDGYLSVNETLMQDKFDTCIQEQPGQDYVNHDYYDRQTDWKSVVSMDKRVLFEAEGLSVTNLKKDGVTIHLDYRRADAENVFLDLPLVYIDGYEAREMDSGEKLAVERGENNRVRVWLPQKETGSITVCYKGLALFQIFDVISIMTAGVWILSAVWRKTKKRRI